MFKIGVCHRWLFLTACYSNLDLFPPPHLVLTTAPFSSDASHPKPKDDRDRPTPSKTMQSLTKLLSYANGLSQSWADLSASPSMIAFWRLSIFANAHLTSHPVPTTAATT